MTIETSAILKLVDEFTAPAKKISGVSGKLDKTLRATQKNLAHLKSDRSDITSFTHLKKQSNHVRTSLNEQQEEVRRLARAYQSADESTQKISGEFVSAKKKADLLKREYNEQSVTLKNLKKDSDDARLAFSNQQKEVSRLAKELRKSKIPSQDLTETFKKANNSLALLKAQKEKNSISLKRIREQSNTTRSALNKQNQEVTRLSKAYRSAQTPAQKLANEFNEAKKKAAQLKQQNNRQSSSLEQLRRQLKKAGVDTRNLSKHDKQLARDIEKANRKIRTQAKLLGSFKAVSEHAKQMSMHLKSAGWYGAKLGAVMTGLGYGFKRTFVDSASQFERFRTVLITLNNGDVGKAQREFAWINKFVAQTPYKVDQVTEAFVKLRAYGIDPTTGSARILGDAASALDKDYLQAVEAIADALNGENERLKEAFNIKASVEGNEIVYRYTDIKTGMEATARAARDSRKDIEATLLGILDKNYAGAMADQVETWAGMVSLISDQWTRFVNLVMDHGLFDWMKGELGIIIKQLDEMAASGELEAYAREFSKNLQLFMKEGWEVLKALFQIIKAISKALKWAADALGGWNNLAWVLIGLPLALKFLGIALSVFELIKSLKALGIIGSATSGKMSLIGKIGKALGTAFLWLGKTVLPLVGKAILWIGRALLANPIGLAITAIAGGAYLIIKYWKPIKAFFADLWESMREPLVFAYNMVMKYSPFGLLLKGLNKLKGLMKGGWQNEEVKVAVETTKHIKQLSANDPYHRADIKAFTSDKKTASGNKPYAPLRQTHNASKTETFYSSPTIQVYAAPGMNEEDVAKMVSREVDKANRQSERRQRGRLYQG